MATARPGHRAVLAERGLLGRPALGLAHRPRPSRWLRETPTLICTREPRFAGAAGLHPPWREQT